MNLFVLGASGGVGRRLVALACDHGHTVTALTRRPDGIDCRARVITDDVLRPECLSERLGVCDVVLSALGIKRAVPANPWSQIVSPSDFSEMTAVRLVAAMKKIGIPRVVAVSAAGVADSASRMNVLMKFLVGTSNVGVAYRDLAAMERVFAESELDWCCPRPTRLTNGPLTGRVAITDSFPMAAAISRSDVAYWMLAQAAAPVRNRTPIITGSRRA